MDMVVQEEASHEEPVASDPDSEYAQAVVKGKRSKRLRGHHVPPAMSNSSSGGSVTEEEEDMANCLILLARGRGPPEDAGDYSGARDVSRGEPPAAKAGPPSYECKTCGKCFPSFQALGGHRTSHKKPKTAAVQEEEKAKACREEVGLLQMRIAPSYDDHVPAVEAKPRVHECSICGSEFTSGQALGGHMRRHRSVAPPPPAGSPEEPKKERSILSLDLNLPAPQEDEHPNSSGGGGGFRFPNKPPPPVIALVDCHY